MPAPDPLRDVVTIERIVAVDPPREPRLSPRDRAVTYTADLGGARQVMVLPLRGGLPYQVTAGEQPASDPQWSPDGRRIAFVRDKGIWVVDADGSREIRVSRHPAGDSAPRWSPDGGRIGYLSRRRGWSQVLVIDAPVPRRGRPRREPRPVSPAAVTPTGLDVEDFRWSPDGTRLAIVAHPAEPTTRDELRVLDIATGELRPIGAGDWETDVSWLPDGSLLFATDATGWFQVVRATADGRERTVLTAGEREHGNPGEAFGFAPLGSPDGSRFVHIEVHDGLCDLLVAPLAAAAPVKRGRGRPPKVPRPVESASLGAKLNPWAGVWRAVAWFSDGTAVLALGESETRPQDLWILPVPGVAPEGARPRQLTDSLPAVLRPAFAPGRAIPGERVRFGARDGLAVEGTLWRPPSATGKRGGVRVPTVVYPHGGPTAQSFRGWMPFKQALVRDGMAFLDVDFRGSSGYGRAFRDANVGEWGHADVFDLIDGARWVLAQPWSDGRLAIYGGSYGGYMVLCALVEEPSLWRAGVDLYGDSEIAESFRHGDRPGRHDLQRMMGHPDEPANAELYRRGSPVYRAERIEAPLLILHGRRDKRVVPLMSERMVRALEIEDKHHEVVWYEDEAHGWERRENRRDAFTRIRAFLRTHLLEEAPDS